MERPSNPWQWLTDSYEEPVQRHARVSSSRPQPVKKKVPAVKITPNMQGVRTDEELRSVLSDPGDAQTVVSFGSSWCTHCHEMLPHFLRLSKQFPKNKYVVAQVDYMKDEAKGIRYTPTYAFYSKGKKVDEFFGSDEGRLRDHLWLHSS